jgi:filamentous hemagglutinin
VQGAVADANFAQPVINAKRLFSDEGIKKYSALAGRPVATVDDLTSALLSGEVRLSQIPVDFVDVSGTRLILNTKTSTALRDAGIPRSEWYGVNRAGQIQIPATEFQPAVTFEQAAQTQLANNKKVAIPGQIGWPELHVPKRPK